jgi:threonine/homoserine/homoserine lactone efflux protein
LTGALGDVLFYGIAAALTPTAILVGLLLLLTPRPRPSGGAFLGGWLLGLFLSAFVLLRFATAPPSDAFVRSEPLFQPVVILLAGLALVVSGVLALRGRGKTPKEPEWLRRVNSVRPGHALGIGFGLAALSPKLILLTAATLAALILSGASPPQELVGVAVYILVASLPIAIPVAFVFVERERAPERLMAWKTWLIGHQRFCRRRVDPAGLRSWREIQVAAGAG